MTLSSNLLGEYPLIAFSLLVMNINETAYFGIAACKITNVFFTQNIKDRSFVSMECLNMRQVLCFIHMQLSFARPNKQMGPRTGKLGNCKFLLFNIVGLYSFTISFKDTFSINMIWYLIFIQILNIDSILADTPFTTLINMESIQFICLFVQCGCSWQYLCCKRVNLPF